MRARTAPVAKGMSKCSAWFSTWIKYAASIVISQPRVTPAWLMSHQEIQQCVAGLGDRILEGLVNAISCRENWPFPVDVQEGKAELKAPWVSAMIQGLALSALVRAHRLKLGRADLLELCHSALCVYGRKESAARRLLMMDSSCSKSIRPIRCRASSTVFCSAFSAYDYWIESDETLARNLFEKGVAGLAHTLEYWNYKDRWTVRISGLQPAYNQN